MKSKTGFLLPLLLVCLGIARTNGETSSDTRLRWLCSTEKSRWQELAATNTVAPAPADVIKLDPKTVFQTMDGFDGCFNELGWEALVSLPADRREAALKELFAPEGANFTLCRAPMGANDFSLGWYSLNETPGDYEMKNFSIERNREALIPFIKAAMKYQPKLGVWAVPWCPPSWMTTNGRYRQGEMKSDPRTFAAYALYFSKFVQAWRAEGINLYAIHPQNEPLLNDNLYPQCKWKGADMNVFLRDHLLPQLKKDNISIEVWLGTLVNDNMADYVDPVLSDPKTAPQIVGVGFQYGGQKIIRATHEKYPDKKLAQTETECYGGWNAWDQCMMTFGHIVEDTTNFASSYFFWNMVLDESGLSRWNWKQNCLLTVDRRSQTVIYNAEFYAMKHFSATVLPGARRIAVDGGPFKEIVAFQNPDGSKVLAFANGTDQTVSVAVQTGGGTFRLDVPAKSMNTLVQR
ncbi:MAG TPA: glycoside hydrolase family 30 beta sandwich domain-containing protein, partial [Candidatus Paceibacterota bacterium]|nr:glycoside hydrolase family 30 beta sandwich domain-containing protein [Candidatus Paceibacterota bacterium]